MFKKIKRVHFVGIGGIGMSGIAELLLRMGYEVSGSDLRRTSITERLEELGARVWYGHKAEHVSGADVVVYSTAVPPFNPELQEASRRKVPAIRRAEMLGELMRMMRYSIGVAGTHGKTTTTSMIGAVLTEGGLDPTLIVGGRVKSIGSNARLGGGDYLVAEADEFDRSFLRLAPIVAVITTLEAEHLDYYRDLDEIKAAFVEYANKVPFYGWVVACLDEEGVQDILPRVERPLITYGLSAQADVRAEGVEFAGMGSRFRVAAEGEPMGEVRLQVPGPHNVKNALAAVSVGLALEVPFEAISKALEKFSGVHRRFEVKGEARGVLIVDDYAHHPSEIRVTLQAARLVRKGRIVAVFQPHLYSRTRDFAGLFGRSFLESDLLVVTDVYPAREEPIPGVSGELVADAARKLGHREVYYVEDKEKLAEFVAQLVRPGDMAITMGAGDIWKVGEALLRALGREDAAVPEAGG
ncbi:MAG TPA: UDP-N-acetylmuramate--L-alanine ligase [Candidatus Latescibacteria bacterium]|nr:UDP-N-acetylmuramate--L-alanine ligase [Candidatus Latescibacterota bacterium]